VDKINFLNSNLSKLIQTHILCAYIVVNYGWDVFFHLDKSLEVRHRGKKVGVGAEGRPAKEQTNSAELGHLKIGKILKFSPFC
jgi:hypothetical protein